MRSGAQLVVDVERLQVTHDGPNKQISRIAWSDTDGGNRLLGLVPTEVVAVVELDAPPPPPPHLYSPAPDADPVNHPGHRGVTCEQYEARQG
jgi:hypothetical protein